MQLHAAYSMEAIPWDAQVKGVLANHLLPKTYPTQYPQYGNSKYICQDIVQISKILLPFC